MGQDSVTGRGEQDSVNFGRNGQEAARGLGSEFVSEVGQDGAEYDEVAHREYFSDNGEDVFFHSGVVEFDETEHEASSQLGQAYTPPPEADEADELNMYGSFSMSD